MRWDVLYIGIVRLWGTVCILHAWDVGDTIARWMRAQQRNHPFINYQQREPGKLLQIRGGGVLGFKTFANSR